MHTHHPLLFLCTLGLAVLGNPVAAAEFIEYGVSGGIRHSEQRGIGGYGHPRPGMANPAYPQTPNAYYNRRANPYDQYNRSVEQGYRRNGDEFESAVPLSTNRMPDRRLHRRLTAPSAPMAQNPRNERAYARDYNTHRSVREPYRFHIDPTRGGSIPQPPDPYFARPRGNYERHYPSYDDDR